MIGSASSGFGVFPAPAGMNREPLKRYHWLLRVPRACGDEPGTVKALPLAAACSPRLRG
uniref:Uncharacterized protein n=1 Tax=mine drainage metagenome TaxID=410659 RepID=E6QU56_9ZZZZ